MIQDIPKLYTALAEWLACVLFVRLLPQRYNAAKTAGILAAALPLFGLVQWLIGIVPLSLWIPGIYQTDAFSRVASVSGSLWFPGIKEYVVSRTPVKKPADIFFSLGDRECRTQNSLLRCVQQNTESIERYYHEQGIDTTFQLNPGNHFKDVVQRTAAGLQWLLSREYDP